MNPSLDQGGFDGRTVLGQHVHLVATRHLADTHRVAAFAQPEIDLGHHPVQSRARGTVERGRERGGQQRLMGRKEQGFDGSDRFFGQTIGSLRGHTTLRFG